MDTRLNKLEPYWAKGKEFLGSEYAIMGGAMSWVSEHHLVAAVSNAGGFGVLATGAMPLDIVKEEIAKIRQMTFKPFGVNIVTMRPDIVALIELCIQEKISHVVLAGGVPSSSSIKQLKQEGIKVICFAPALVFAKRLVKLGVDALVVEGTEAGGHIGPISTMVLLQEIVPNITEVPVFVAGGIGSGISMVAALKAGASGVQLGTGLVCAHESIAHENFKKAFIRANSRDAVSTIQIDPEFPVIPVRALQNDGTKEFMKVQQEAIAAYRAGELSKEDAILKIEHFWAGALRRAVIDGDVQNGSVMAGQCVGLVKGEKPVKDILDELISEAIQLLT
ncbi:MAG: NAD(P)H-dependent flavin oxidoreductase [Alphaproteobacteria bacterium]